MAKQVDLHEWAGSPLNIGVINPFALTDVVTGRRTKWKRVAYPQAIVEKALETKYEDLLDPATSPLLYMGIDLPQTTTKDTAKRIPPAVAKFASSVSSMALQSAMGMPKVVPDATVEVGSGDWSPPGANWIDPGSFFVEGTEMEDPLQGALGDCYFIAALSSVAWARPYVIADRNRTIGTGKDATYWDLINFYPQPKAKPEEAVVTELLPMVANGSYIYARSSDAGEIWPAIYEKAYARWKTNGTDKPEFPKIAGGDPVRAASELTGLDRYYYVTNNMSVSDIRNQIGSNSMNFLFNKTFNPMVAWTYGSAKDAPDKIDYPTAGLVANHAYSILGSHTDNSQKYVILRNPWGNAEAKIDTTTGMWIAREAPTPLPALSHPINLGLIDGVFALALDAFKKYFWGFGVVK